jgi:hypothetical protein
LDNPISVAHGKQTAEDLGVILDRAVQRFTVSAKHCAEHDDQRRAAHCRKMADYGLILRALLDVGSDEGMEV